VGGTHEKTKRQVEKEMKKKNLNIESEQYFARKNASSKWWKESRHKFIVYPIYTLVVCFFIVALWAILVQLVIVTAGHFYGPLIRVWLRDNGF
jgi:Flp pilus assembly protein TadB